MRSLRAVMLVAASSVSAAWGHDGEVHASAWDTLLAKWTFDPLVVVLLIASVVLYVAGAWRLRGTSALRRWEPVVFFVGIASVVIALISPLDALSDALFAAHMSQHEVLMLISAPLLVLGRPLIVFLWALPREARERTGRWTRRPRVRVVWHGLTHPLVVVLVHAAAIWSWHVPALFEAALASESVHTVQHACFFLTAGLFWWALAHGRYGRAGYGVAALYVFATALHTGLLGAMVTLGRTVWYPTYATRAPELGMTALEDQQLAGLIMWVPAGVLFTVLGLALIAAWLGESERKVRLGTVDALTASGTEKRS